MGNTRGDKRSPKTMESPPTEGYAWDLQKIDRLIRELREAERKEALWFERHQATLSETA